MNKKIKYLLLFFTCFCMFSTNVNAIEFYWEDRIYFDKNLKFSENKTNNFNKGSLIKKYKNANITGVAENGYAYCSDRRKDFKTGTAYVKDTTYTDAQCYYEQKNNNGKWQRTAKASGDCSKIIGYIIKTARKESKKDFEKYGYAQSAVWTFLGKYSTKEEWKTSNNKNINTIYNNNKTIRTILRTAFKKYDEYITATGDTTTKTKQKKLFKINDNDNYDKKVYFIPNYDKCGTDGVEYRTKKMTITNISDKSITVDFAPTSPGYEIIIKDKNGETTCGSDGCTKEINKNKGKLEFYLKITNNKIIDDIKLNIKATQTGETETKKTSITTYDSIKYKRKGNTYQGLIILKTKESTTKNNINYKYYQNAELDFTQEKVTSYIPEDDGTKKNAESKCANNAKVYNDSHAELSATTCKVITLDDKSKVRIILKEIVNFDYGYLFPSKYDGTTNKSLEVYSGGSFVFNTNESLGLTSNYSVKIGWKFADYKGNTPYYYNETNSETNPTTKIGEINEKLITSVKNNLENLNLKIDTLDSNKLDESGEGKKATYDYEINLKKDSQKITYNDSVDEKNLAFRDNIKNNMKELKIDITGIELKKYRMKTGENGIVEYLNHNKKEYNDTTQNYKRAYFVPMYYPDGVFKFNIDKSNLSLVDGIDLKYEASCAIGVKNQFNQKSLRYRNISVSNPFPKANTNTGEGMASNWKNWYVNNTTNQQRIADSYKNQLIYSINLDSEKIKKIDEINKASSYTDWKNIDTSTGTSKVIVGGEYSLFDTRASNNSYCKIGEFKNECDK